MSEEVDKKHWADREERGSFLLMKFTAFAAKVLGRRLLSPLLYGIVLYFFLFGRIARRSAWQYQQRLAEWSRRDDLRPSHWRVFSQFMTFADSLLDKLDVWNGKLSIEQIEIIDPALLRKQLRGSRGQLLVGAHLGNLEVCRALAEIGEKVTMNVLVHTKHAEQFNRLLGEAGATNLRLIQVSELDPVIMLQLHERLERGEWLAIAGDRVPLHGGRSVTVDFLGHPAPFPQGPWLLAGLLKVPGQPADVSQATRRPLSPDSRTVRRGGGVDTPRARAGHSSVGHSLRAAPESLLPRSPAAMVQLLPFLEDR